MANPAPDTRDHILDAAEDLFARQGLGPTTIKQIGQAASQNPALLYYYYGSKEGLYQAVLRRVMEAMVQRGGAALRASHSPPDAVRGLVKAQVDFLLAHPNAPKLLVREMVDHDARQAEALLLETAAGIFQRLCRVIEQGQQKGVFRKDIEPRFAAISTISQAIYFTVARPAVSLFLSEPITPPLARSFAKHAGDFAVSALRVASPSRRAAEPPRRRTKRESS